MFRLSNSQLFIACGLLSSILGSGVLVWRAAKKYFKSKFSKKAKQEIEDEAISVSYNRLASENRNDMLADSIVRGYIATYKSSLLGFLLLIIGFILQLIGTLI
ncbi:MAG: hypothetical protein JXC36_03450 [Candidatus Atribacteria bacterium]|nr:hypothetical protein [Candidatus Atribacteria bacterium]